MMEHGFKDKVVLITGCASGIGLSQAQAFLSQDGIVIGVDCQSTVELRILNQAWPEKFYFFQRDISQTKEVASLAAEVRRETGLTVDILVNTAGVLDDFKPTLDTTEAEWDRIMSTNVKGTYLMTNAFLPAMLAKGRGVVVNMSSVAGLVAGGGGAAYTASKHAVVGYTKQLDLDYAKQGIRANAIAPGAIKTPMNAKDFEGTGEMAKWVAEETPAGRWADPKEVANLTLYLASDLADYIHGTVVPIDGGWLEK